METVTDGQLGHRIWGTHPEMGRQVGPPPPHIPLGGFCSSYPTGACSRHTPWVPRTYLVFPPACPERSTTPGLAVGWQEGACPPPTSTHSLPSPFSAHCPPCTRRAQPALLECTLVLSGMHWLKPVQGHPSLWNLGGKYLILIRWPMGQVVPPMMAP